MLARVQYRSAACRVHARAPQPGNAHWHPRAKRLSKIISAQATSARLQTTCARSDAGDTAAPGHVCIVGGGPVGLCLALLLGRLKVPTIVFERTPAQATVRVPKTKINAEAAPRRPATRGPTETSQFWACEVFYAPTPHTSAMVWVAHARTCAGCRRRARRPHTRERTC